VPNISVGGTEGGMSGLITAILGQSLATATAPTAPVQPTGQSDRTAAGQR
jgi:hypothetical protein